MSGKAFRQEKIDAGGSLSPCLNGIGERLLHSYVKKK